MPVAGPAIVLASASPRRRELLARAGLAFTVEPADVDESAAPDAEPEALALALAEKKARAVAELHRGAPLLVLGADTVVALGVSGATRLLGKPAGEDEARAMLASLSGTTHRVVTGVCVIAADSGRAHRAAECTAVTMRRITGPEIEAYVASGEWRDKAGGYAIQESADAFVTRLAGGGFDNVVGLPVARTLALLREAGAVL